MFFQPTNRIAICMSLAASMAAALALTAETMTLRPVADTRLSEQFPDSNAGAAADIVIGTQGPTAGNPRNRGLIRFDLAGQIPPLSEIKSAAMTLTVAKVPLGGADSIFELRRVLQEWNENEATWNSRFSTNAPWSSPGGDSQTDFSSIVSATQVISGLGGYTFDSTTNLLADVQAWLDEPTANFGWIVLTQSEDAAKTARRFASREGGAGAPTLVVDFVPPPTISDASPQDTNVTFHFTVVAGYDYTVEYADAIPSTNWLVLTNFGAKVAAFEAGVTNSILTIPSRFFRLSRVPCNCR